MKIQRCDKGHMYEEINEFCPYCSVDYKKNDIKVMNSNIESKNTVVYVDLKIDPVVAWLVCIEGAEKGKDYRLLDQRNFIGNDEMDGICIMGDDNIKKNHFTITYNSKSQIFVISPGVTGDLIYLNKKAVYETTIIENFGLIEIGNTKLVFVKFCGENFNWS